MRHTLLLFVILISCMGLSQRLTAQNWTSTDRQDFIDGCMGEAEGIMGENQSRDYCYCMLYKVMDIYDTPEASNSMTEAEALPMAEACIESLNIVAQEKQEWELEEKENFIKVCVGETEETLGANSARQYCYCMLFKLMDIYETASEADLMTQEEIMPLATECLGSQIWSSEDQESFLYDCIDTGEESMGEHAAVNYCNCMAQELAIMFPDPNDYNLSEDELTALAKKCLFQE
ncbi:MAG: hypothetical protein R8G66_08780 [Cytophagales bacterium]|nr:hypothetical protein [Cytophagales bacterium]